MPALSLDTLGEIFTYLSPIRDSVVLASCSLVCSDWEAASKRHKFRQIHIKNVEKCAPLLYIIQNYSIAQYIHELEVPVPDSRYGGGAVAPLIKTLPRILRLCIYVPNGNRFVYPRSKIHHTIVDAIATRSSLRHLELRFAVLAHTDQILNVIRHLTNLHHLDLLGTTFDESQLPNPHSQPQPKASGVTKLTISCVSLMSLLGKPDSGPIDLLKITQLNIHLFRVDASDFNQLISAAKSLEQLEITVGTFIGTLPQITLWSSVSLKTVVVNMHSVDLLWLDEDPLEWMKTHFALIPEHNILRTVRLSLYIKDASESGLCRLFKAWLEFHKLLDGERFRAVKDICVEIYLGWTAMQEFDQMDEFNFPEFAQGFPKRRQYKIQNTNFGKSKQFSYHTAQ